MVQLTHKRFTTEEYHRMVESGILREDDRVELIEGEILEMPPIGSPHAGVVDYLTSRFASRLEQRAQVRVQSPIHLDEHSEPQPDLALLRPRSDFYRSAHPVPADVLLAVEVADSTLEYDRQVKLRLYAQAGIQEVWIVNLELRQVELYRSPRATGYSEVSIRQSGDEIAPSAFPDVSIRVEPLLGM